MKQSHNENVTSVEPAEFYEKCFQSVNTLMV